MFLAIDQGGHSSRAVLFDDDGGRTAAVAVPLRDRRPRQGWVETDAEEAVATVREAVARVFDDRAGASPVGSAGIAAQRASVVCWDAVSGAALSPLLSWQDRRAEEWMRSQGLDAGDVRERTGLFLSPHFGAGKLRWCLDHLEPVREAARRGRLRCGPWASYLAHRLLRERPDVAEPCTAGRTLLWSRRTRDWDPDLAASFGIPLLALPACVPNRRRFGALDVPGTAAGIPLRILAGDQNAALYAAGPPALDEVVINAGTGAFVLRRLDRDPGPVDGLLTAVAHDDGARLDWMVEGTINGAGSALDWLERTSGASGLAERVPAWLEGEDGEPPLFLNGVSGLGSPWWRPSFPSRFLGDAPIALQAVALIESVVFLAKVLLERLGEARPSPVRRVRLGGGLARLDGMARRLAALSGLEVVRDDDVEATSRGLAVLAGLPVARGGFTRFEPRDDPALRRRYVRWRNAMDDALAHDPPDLAG